MPDEPETTPKAKTPDSLPPIPPIAAEEKAMVEPTMIRTVHDVVQPSEKKEAADIHAHEKMTAGQRLINVIWETTQAIIAIMVTASTLYVAGALALKGEGESAAFLLLSNVFFVVISTYIQRTNHKNTGGVKAGDQGR